MVEQYLYKVSLSIGIITEKKKRVIIFYDTSFSPQIFYNGMCFCEEYSILVTDF